MLIPFVAACALTLAQSPAPTKKPLAQSPAPTKTPKKPVAATAQPQPAPPPTPDPAVVQAELLAAFTAAFNSQGDAVGACVLDTAPADTTNWVQAVKATAVVNAEGQLFSLDVVLDPAPPEAAKTSACIDKALRAATWPKASGPMVSADHAWTFKAQ